MKKIAILLETSRAFGRQLIIGIARYSRINGPWSFYKEPIDLKSSIPYLTSWKPDGIIMRDSLITKELLKLKVPTIFAIHNSKYPKTLPIIKTDSFAIAKMASEHLLSKGLKNFAFCGFDDFDWSKERGYYFNYFINEVGCKVHIYAQPLNTSKLDWRKEQQHVGKWINSLPKPVGIFACNDDRGQHILEVCKMINLKVPEDVTVIGVDNDPMICETGYPPLTSIALNVESAGYESAKLLHELLSGKKMEGQQIIVSPTHVVQRQSTDILSVDNHDVALAIRYIRDNAKSKILVRDVVKATGISRHTLEKYFKGTIHRSIYDEIREVRVEWISKLLIETNLTIYQITSLFNFTDVEHISRYFKKEKGIGLTQFRKLHQTH
ncbi:MAG: DNA-binding transcriptional regulator [bacterium]